MVAYSILWATTIGAVCSRVPIWHRSHAIMQTIHDDDGCSREADRGKGRSFPRTESKG